jgi:DNA modification methylase
MAKRKQPIEKDSQQIEQIATAELIPYARNARTHSDEQVAQIAASIREFGFCNPVLIDAEGTIIAGHGRVMAATRMKLETVPCLRLSHLTDAQKRAYVIADNRIALSSGWDEAMLANELSDLHADEFDLSVLGFDADELTALMDLDLTGEEEPSGEIVEDEVPEVPADPITKPGDLWILGSHRLLCGDSTKAADVGRLMGAERADLVFTDPPYNCADEMSASFYENSNSPAMKGLAAAKWDKGFDIDSFLKTIESIRPENGSVYVCTSHMLAPQIWKWMHDSKASHHSYVIWCKPNPMPSLAKRHPTWATEIICYATFGKHVFNFPESGHSLSWWSINKNAKNDLHPTQKPVAVPARAIELSSNQKGLVYDAFLGSGTTLIAAEQLNRKCYGMEISPAYCDVIVKRWENLTGKTAVLEAV